MNKRNSTLAILLLGLLAIFISLWKTFEVSDSLTDSTTAILIFVEAVAALVMLSIAFVLVRRRFSGRVSPTSVAVVRPLRRLVSDVWS